MPTRPAPRRPERCQLSLDLGLCERVRHTLVRADRLGPETCRSPAYFAALASTCRAMPTHSAALAIRSGLSLRARSACLISESR
jgi:hypothetical protein